ncbi:hypothetical protein GDO81_000073 [Engystomops pustulosus]|uniref:Uncharacterized protein n=1 Tax=Engystomops pustulosus TaxID=76066 RepID=A0AAV7D1C9_ENGPU|nr:hypothetical protein GDO81_000073 [Engystomops pustulosus]
MFVSRKLLHRSISGIRGLLESCVFRELGAELIYGCVGRGCSRAECVRHRRARIKLFFLSDNGGFCRSLRLTIAFTCNVLFRKFFCVRLGAS